MPYRVSRDSDPIPRFDLLPGEEACNYEDGDFVPKFPGLTVGDLVLVENNIHVSRIVAEEERGHKIEHSHDLDWEWVE